MGIINTNKQIDTVRIDCNGMLKVTLALNASPDISSNPADIVLILDRSGSMAGGPLANMKTGAKTFIDIIDEATDGAKDGNIGGGSHIGIVSFSSTARQDTQLITSAETLKDAVDTLQADGQTNHADAFTKAIELFDPQSANAKIIVMFTDGKTTAGAPPAPIAAAAKEAGIIIYCIGLIGADGIDVSVLNEWATDPDSAHVAVTPDEADLEELFQNLAENISKPGATNIVINETINADFTITSVLPPSKGTATMVNSRVIRWEMPELGTTANEGAILEFYICHIGQNSGTKQVNSEILYTDTEKNAVNFPDPSVLVECGEVVYQEPCPVPVDILAEGCQDSVQVNLGDIYMDAQGCIVQLDLRLKNVCPGKRVALAVVLTEIDCHGEERQMGMRTVTVPAHSYKTCRDIHVKCLRFVVPGDANGAGYGTGNCPARKLRARVFANTLDTDFQCCGSKPPVNPAGSCGCTAKEGGQMK